MHQHLTLHYLDLTPECTEATKDSLDKDGDTAVETNSAGAIISGKYNEFWMIHVLYFYGY